MPSLVEVDPFLPPPPRELYLWLFIQYMLQFSSLGPPRKLFSPFDHAFYVDSLLRCLALV